MAFKSNKSCSNVLIADILQIVHQIRQTLVPFSKCEGVPTFTAVSTLPCNVRITNSHNQSQIHSLFLLHIPSAGELLAYSVGYFFAESFVHRLTQKPLSITQTFSRWLVHTQWSVFTNSTKIQSLDLIHPSSQSCHRSYTHSIVHSALHSQIHFTSSLSIRSLNHSLIHRLAQSLTFTCIHSFNRSQVSFTAFFSQSSIHTNSHCLILSLIYWDMQ
jgi:hypothetical protein